MLEVLADAYSVLYGVINLLNNVYIGTITTGETILSISLLDVLEVIFGVNLMIALVAFITGFEKQLGSR